MIDMQELIKKHAKNFVQTEGTRKMLEGIFYQEDGSVVMTDSHILLHVKDVHDYQQPIVKHYFTGRAIEGDYPNVNNMLNIPYSNEFTLNMKKIAPYLETLKVSNLIGDVGILKDDLTFKVSSIGNIGESYILTLDGHTHDGFSATALKSTNLYKCLSFFKDLKVDVVRVQLAASGFIPIRFTDEAERVLVLIAPVKIGG